MVSYYKTADVYIDLYIKGGTKYTKIGSCTGHATNEEAGDYLSVILNPDPQSFKDYTLTASSYSGSIDLYITIHGTVSSKKSDIGSGISSSDPNGTVIMNSDSSLTYKGGNTIFKYCSSNSTFTTYINGSKNSSYTGTTVINNSNTKGNYGTVSGESNSGSYQIYIPTSISNPSSISYSCTAMYNANTRIEYFNGSFESNDYIQIGSLYYSFGYLPGDSTDANYKYNPINSFGLYAIDIHSEGMNREGLNVTCTAGSDISNNTFITGPITINYKRPEIKLNSNLNLNFCCNPELTSTNLYYIGTEKLTNTDLVPATEWAKINFKFAGMKTTRGFDAISYFYLDINKELPGKITIDEDELLSVIKNENYKEYDEKLKEFRNTYNNLEDGKASQRVINNLILSQN